MSIIESLEHRTLFAGVSAQNFDLTAHGTLAITGTSKADAIDVSFVRSDPKKGFIATITSGSSSASFKAKFAKVKRISIDAGGGDDSILVIGGSDQTRPVTILGDAGDDKINYNVAGAVFASGGSGNDIVGATAALLATSTRNSVVINKLFAENNTTAVNTILGGDGNDTLSGDTNDQIDGGPGTDLGVIAVGSSVGTITADRRNALAELYYAHLKPTSVEQTEGFAFFSVPTN